MQNISESPRNALIIMLLATALVGAGCGAAKTATDAPEVKDQATSTAAETATTTGQEAPTPAPAPAQKPATPATKTVFYVEADDNGFYPASGTARKGSTVTVTFFVRPGKTFHNNLTIRSNKYDLGVIQAGTSKSVSFPAEANLTFSSSWPNGSTKGNWTLFVK